MHIGNLEENTGEEKLREYIEKRWEKAGINSNQKFSNARSSAEKRENWAVGLLPSPLTTLSFPWVCL